HPDPARRLRPARDGWLAPVAQHPGQAPLDDEARRGAADPRRARARLGDACLPPLRLRDGLLMATQNTRGLTLDLRVERFPYHQPFRISGHVFSETALLVATLSDGAHVGRGEGAGVYYLGDDIDHMLAEATRVRGAIEDGATREELQHLLPPGGARNALDCAFWDLEAKQAGRP